MSFTYDSVTRMFTLFKLFNSAIMLLASLLHYVNTFSLIYRFLRNKSAPSFFTKILGTYNQSRWNQSVYVSMDLCLGMLFQSCNFQDPPLYHRPIRNVQYLRDHQKQSIRTYWIQSHSFLKNKRNCLYTLIFFLN